MVTMMTEPTLSVRTLSNTFITNFAKLLAIVAQDTHCQSLQLHQMLCTAERQAQHLTAEKQASLLLSLSPLTFTHDHARVILTEQLYRCLMVMAGHPYHHV